MLTFNEVPEALATILQRQTDIENLLREILSTRPGKEETNEDLTVSELAAYLRCSRVTVQARKRDGTFPYYQVGRKIFFRKSEIDKVLRISGYGEKKGGKAL